MLGGGRGTAIFGSTSGHHFHPQQSRLPADMSPMYLYFFIVPCYYIINLGCFIYIYKQLYIIFGD